MDIFEFVNAINTSKQDLIRKSNNPELAEKSYNSFFVNRALSYFVDTILYANEINMLNHVENKLQNDFYLNNIRVSKRFSKWAKPIKSSDIESIKEYYNVNYTRALEISGVLTREQIDHIKTRIIKGGSHVQHKPTSGSETR